MANGFILWEGKSRLDGEPIVVIAVGIRRKSKNSKTGEMVQVYILYQNLHPVEALRTGADFAICGNCPHRGDGNGNGRVCYVQLRKGPGSVWRAYKRGSYPYLQARNHAAAFVGRSVRLGTYGDPGAAPTALWRRVVRHAKNWTAYTHQWRRRPSLRDICMASCDSAADFVEARAGGWRTFRAKEEDSPSLPGEISCPASKEMGKRTTCEKCGLCDGARPTDKRATITLNVHGNGRKHFSV